MTPEWHSGGHRFDPGQVHQFSIAISNIHLPEKPTCTEIWATPESNGGVLFRITDAKDPGIENGYELNVNDNRKDQTGRTGSIVNVAKPLVKVDSASRWMTIEITARGAHMTAKLDGKLTAEADDTNYASGPVALQAAGGLVRYRNVQIRALK